MKNNRGITLIALVITIIILIILAGISISLLMGEDGLISKAKQGAQNYQNAALEEQEMLNNFYGDFASEIAKTGSSDAAASLIAFKRAIAGAITNAGVATSENDSVETMVNNIAQLKTGTLNVVNDFAAFKRAIAGAITNAGVATSENDSTETMTSNIGKIYQKGYTEGGEAAVKPIVIDRLTCQGNTYNSSVSVNYYFDVRDYTTFHFETLQKIYSINGMAFILYDENDNQIYSSGYPYSPITDQTVDITDVQTLRIWTQCTPGHNNTGDGFEVLGIVIQ